MRSRLSCFVSRSSSVVLILAHEIRVCTSSVKNLTTREREGRERERKRDRERERERQRDRERRGEGERRWGVREGGVYC